VERRRSGCHNAAGGLHHAGGPQIVEIVPCSRRNCWSLISLSCIAAYPLRPDWATLPAVSVGLACAVEKLSSGVSSDFCPLWVFHNLTFTAASVPPCIDNMFGVIGFASFPVSYPWIFVPVKKVVTKLWLTNFSRYANVSEGSLHNVEFFVCYLLLFWGKFTKLIILVALNMFYKNSFLVNFYRYIIEM
jgi:hypothetical protein